MERKPEDKLLIRMVIGILVYATLVQILLFIISNTLLYQSIGLWIGALVGIAMLIHIKNTIVVSLELGEIGALKHTKKMIAIRMTAVIVVFGITFYYDLGSMLTTFIGVMGLKVTAYIQPFINRYADSK